MQKKQMGLVATGVSLAFLCSLVLARPSQSGATQPPAAVTVHLTLSAHDVVAGKAIEGAVVLTNTTRRRILVDTCAANGWLQVGLKGHGFTFDASSLLIACPPTVRLKPGPNRFPVTVRTTYQECLQPGGQSLLPVPACTSAGPPPLPAGTYSTTVIIVGLAHLTTLPNRILVSLRSPPTPRSLRSHPSPGG